MLAQGEDLLEGRVPARDIEIFLFWLIGKPEQGLLLQVKPGQLHRNTREGKFLPIKSPQLIILGLILDYLISKRITAYIADQSACIGDHFL